MKSQNSKTKATLDEIRHAYDTANPDNRPKQGGTPLDAVIEFKTLRGYVDLDDPEQKRKYLSNASTKQEIAEAERLQAGRAKAKQEHKQAIKNLSRYERISAAAGNKNPKPMTVPRKDSKPASRALERYATKKCASIIKQGGRIEFSKKDDPTDYNRKFMTMRDAKKAYSIDYVTIRRLSDGISAYISRDIIKTAYEGEPAEDLDSLLVMLKTGKFIPERNLSHKTVFVRNRLLRLATEVLGASLYRITDKVKLIGWIALDEQA